MNERDNVEMTSRSVRENGACSVDDQRQVRHEIFDTIDENFTDELAQRITAKAEQRSVGRSRRHAFFQSALRGHVVEGLAIILARQCHLEQLYSTHNIRSAHRLVGVQKVDVSAVVKNRQFPTPGEAPWHH